MRRASVVVTVIDFVVMWGTLH
ncbi:hypothetical protein PSCLAVI8L_270025 [Pseudoclavibacter sp. 8L]|nr:hypothetical protein PSCLAVI8L_270025 [Pseudoclavibacter sp. 8L]